MARRKAVGRPLLLDDLTERKICAAIKRGAFTWVAAQSAGVSPATFHRWMASDEPRFLKFQENVNRARADARLEAEASVKALKPEVWLRLGPGRDKPGEPGWTESVQHSGPDGGPVQVSISINRTVAPKPKPGGGEDT